MNAWAAARPRAQNKNFWICFALVAVVMLPHVTAATPSPPPWQLLSGTAGAGRGPRRRIGRGAEGAVVPMGGRATGYNCLFISKHCCPYFRPCLCYPFWPHVTWGQASLVSLCVWMNFIWNSAIYAYEIESVCVCVSAYGCKWIWCKLQFHAYFLCVFVVCPSVLMRPALRLSPSRSLFFVLCALCVCVFTLFFLLFSAAVSRSRVLLCV